MFSLDKSSEKTLFLACEPCFIPETSDAPGDISVRWSEYQRRNSRWTEAVKNVVIKGLCFSLYEVL